MRSRLCSGTLRSSSWSTSGTWWDRQHMPREHTSSNNTCAQACSEAVGGSKREQALVKQRAVPCRDGVLAVGAHLACRGPRRGHLAWIIPVVVSQWELQII